MPLGLDRKGFLRHLVERVHVEDPQSGLCVTCSPRQFYPCPVSVAVVTELGLVGESAQAAIRRVQSGSI